MKAITSLNETTKQGKEVLFITGCGWADRARPMIEAFEEKYPEILMYTADKNASPEIAQIAGGASPVFVLFQDGNMYSKFSNGLTTLEEFERAIHEKKQGIIQINLEDIDTIVKTYIKRTLVYGMKLNCESCDEMEAVLTNYGIEHPEVQVFAVPSSTELKAKLGIPEEPAVDSPIIAMFNRGTQSRIFSFGKKGPKEFAYIVSLMTADISDQNSCKNK